MDLDGVELREVNPISMADAIVSIALQRLADVIQKQIQEEVNLVRGVKKEVLYLSSELDAIRNVLEDAERRRYKRKASKIG
ncbi:UNVERIFIED_CONTAM: hypothetical protein Scaly_3066000 [Sesamum calycinum]|uniref:Disease resistance N-terminal domain-containing protein n=1 Tax=Sesamum calycinum TaxID=2727403 RepID=A0AAW2K033_9LAMI